jgi:hypothetical protein
MGLEGELAPQIFICKRARIFAPENGGGKVIVVKITANPPILAPILHCLTLK